MSKQVKKKNYPSVQFGTSLMLVIFMILCLTGFATLSLSSAMRDYEYSKRAADKTSGYYNADAKANKTLAEIADILNNTALTAGADKNTYMEQALTELSKMPKLTITDAETTHPFVSYLVPVNDGQALQVSLALYAPSSEEKELYRIAQWKEVSTQAWDSESTLPVLDGN